MQYPSKLFVALFAIAHSAVAANYVTTAANGTGIPHPLDTTTHPVSAGSATVNVPEGMVFTGITDLAQRASVLLSYTPVDPTYPAPGGFVAQGSVVAGPSGAQRFKISIPAYANCTYEIYGDPTLADLEWKALPFSLTQTGAIDRNKHTATTTGGLDLYVVAAATKGFYKVSFRVPGANTGTP